MISEKFPEYSVEYLSGVMSLRSPQRRSLEILDDILSSVDSKNLAALGEIRTLISERYKIFKDFEHDFMTLAFSLSMGVGKTRLMGAFITYLYTKHDVRNFFVVAPNITIYDKLQKDFSDTSSDKYVFKGVGCYKYPPNIITGENFDTKTLVSQGFGDINIFIFNNAKFNRDTVNIKNFSEILGKSYFQFLVDLSDLVVIMDESHHYRNNSTGKSINELKPFLALELTGTPHTQEGNTIKYFKNVVYDYPMGRAVKDGYTKIPFAMTRRDVSVLNFTNDEMDLMMLSDGINHHLALKSYLNTYAENFKVRKIKPFVLVVCKNTDHADKIEKIVTSSSFFGGYFKDRVLVLHSNQTKEYKDDNIKRLLEVEKSEEPTEIVIHVDILKEGWDVNNLYTIVPLRTASSKTLRMQTVGRGLRLPYGAQTGDRNVDSLTITAHDKFEDIINEASEPNSIFRTENIIYFEDELPTVSFRTLSLFEEELSNSVEQFYANVPQIEKTHTLDIKLSEIQNVIINSIPVSGISVVDQYKSRVVENALSVAQKDKDLAEIIKDHNDAFRNWVSIETEKTVSNIMNNTIFIPEITVKADGSAEFSFSDFDLETNGFDYPKVRNDIEIRNLLDPEDVELVETKGLDFLVNNPHKTLVLELQKIPEIDYEKCADLLNKLVKQLLIYYATSFSELEINHIVMFYKKDIAQKIFKQLMMHFISSPQTLIEVISNVGTTILTPTYNISESIPRNFYNPIEEENIKKYIFDGFKKALHKHYKFDSDPERIFAIICESDVDVIKWFRPAPLQFRLTYKNGKRYQPDFVVETREYYYLVEIKGEDKLNDDDVLTKKRRAIKYCSVASNFCKANGYKEWRHLFIPSKSVKINSSIQFLVSQFNVSIG